MKTGKEVAEVVENFVNSANSSDIKEFADAITQNMHRTLQQKFMGAMGAIIRNWAQDSKDGIFDLRNEATVKLCEKILNKLDKYDLFLPFI